MTENHQKFKKLLGVDYLKLPAGHVTLHKLAKNLGVDSGTIVKNLINKGKIKSIGTVLANTKGGQKRTRTSVNKNLKSCLINKVKNK